MISTTAFVNDSLIPVEPQFRRTFVDWKICQWEIVWEKK